MSESLSLGDDKALTSWHVPKEFHNPATLGSEHHRKFLIHAYEDSQLLAGVQFPLSYVSRDDEIWNMWENIEIIPNVFLNRDGNIAVYYSDDIQCKRHNDLTYITSKGAYCLKTSDINSYRTLEPSPENEVEEEIEKQYTIDFHQMSATMRSLEKNFKDVVMIDKSLKKDAELQLTNSILSSAKIASDTSTQSIENDYISIEHFSGVLSRGSANHVYGHKLNFIPSKNEPFINGIVEKTFQRFTGREPGSVITCVVEFGIEPELFLENSLYASSGWKKKLLECNNLNEHLDGSQSGMNGSRSIRTWGILTDDGFIDQFKLNRIKEKITKVESNLQQFSENQRVSNGRTNLMLLIRDVMTTFSEIEWLPSYKEAFDIITLKIRALFTQIRVLEKEKRGENSLGTQRDLQTFDAILVGLEEQYQRAQKLNESRLKRLVDDLKSTNFSTRYKEELKELACHFDQDKLEAVIDNSKIPPSKKRELKRYCDSRTKMKIRVLGLSRKNYPPELETHWGEVLGSLVNEKYDEIGSLVRFDIKIRERAGVKSLLVTNILLAKDELDENGKLIDELVPKVEIPSPLPENTWLEVNADKDEIMKGETHPSFELYMFIKPRKLYAFHPSFDVEVPIFNTGEVKNDWIGKMKQCKVEIRRDRRKGIFRYYVVEIKS